MVRLSREQARRIAVRAQLLDARRPWALVEVVDELTLLQLDPTAAIAPSADLVCWSRLGEAYEHSDLRDALERERSLVELGSFVRPMDDVGPVLAVEAHGLHPSARDWLATNARFRADVLAVLDERGPLTVAEVPDTSQQPWQSSGWTNDKSVDRMLTLLNRLGEVAVSGRRGKLRTWDLAERVYPADLVLPSYAEAQALLDRRRLGALGIARDTSRGNTGEELGAGGAGVPCTVDGTEGTWRVDPDALTGLDAPFAGRTALLSPYDRLVYDRQRALDLFDFEYVLEMYKPAAQRRWGHFALPILHADRLVGKLDAKADRKKGVLRVNAVHEDAASAGGTWDPGLADHVEAEIDALAAWLGLEVTRGSPSPTR